jgi:predicted dehydrogenase
VFDMGPYYLSGLVTLLGPVAEVQAVGQIGFAERFVTTPGSAFLGQSIKVETLTSVQALLSFASGAHVAFLASWDVWRHGLSPIELHGETGSIRLPDPNFFAGDILIAEGSADWRKQGVEARIFGAANSPPEAPVHSNYRGLGLADMARGILDNRPHRANGEVALHVLAVMEGILNAAISRKTVTIAASCERPAALSSEEGESLLKA